MYIIETTVADFGDHGKCHLKLLCFLVVFQEMQHNISHCESWWYICRTWAVLSLLLVLSRDPIILFSNLRTQMQKWVMQVCSALAVADMPHAHEISGIEMHIWGSGCGIPNPGTAPFIFLRACSVSSVCWSALCLKTDVTGVGMEQISECKAWNLIHLWNIEHVYICRSSARSRFLAVTPVSLKHVLPFLHQSCLFLQSKKDEKKPQISGWETCWLA